MSNIWVTSLHPLLQQLMFYLISNDKVRFQILRFSSASVFNNPVQQYVQESGHGLLPVCLRRLLIKNLHIKLFY